MDIILASGSPRRKELLTQIGLTYRILVPDVDEHTDVPADPAALVEVLCWRFSMRLSDVSISTSR